MFERGAAVKMLQAAAGKKSLPRSEKNIVRPPPLLTVPLSISKTQRDVTAGTVSRDRQEGRINHNVSTKERETGGNIKYGFKNTLTYL